MSNLRIPLKDMAQPTPPGAYIFVRGYTAPVAITVDGDHITVRLRSGGVLGILDEEISRKLTFAPDKLRELQEKGTTRL